VLDSVLIPGSRVRRRIDVIAPVAWMHPRYLLRKIEYRIDDPRCPTVTKITADLDVDLHLIPESFIVWYLPEASADA